MEDDSTIEDDPEKFSLAEFSDEIAVWFCVEGSSESNKRAPDGRSCDIEVSKTWQPKAYQRANDCCFGVLDYRYG